MDKTSQPNIDYIIKTSDRLLEYCNSQNMNNMKWNCAQGFAASLAREAKKLKDMQIRLSAYQRVLELAEVPLLLIEYPELLAIHPLTEEDTEWAKNLIRQYRLEQ